MSAWLKNSALFSPVFDSVAVSVAAGVDAVSVPLSPLELSSVVPHAATVAQHASRAKGPASLLQVIRFLLCCCASPSPRAPKPVRREADGGDDDHALDGVLERTGDALQVQPREQRLEGEGAGHRGHDRSTAATEHDPAQHAGG